VADPIRVALANDYEIVIAGLRALLAPYADELWVVDTVVGREGAEAGVDEPADVTLFDPYGARQNVLDRVRALVEDPKAGAVVVFAFGSRPWSDGALEDVGAAGYISKTAPAPEIVDGIRAAASGKPVRVRHTGRAHNADADVRWPGRDLGLTDRESELLAMLPTGMTNSELARQLFVSENTIKSQLRGLYAKLGVRNRTQAAAIADGDGGLLGKHR
jgi:DNA-binding NarL/FixJ family response regulator